MSKEDWTYLNVPKDTKERIRYLSLVLKKPQGRVMDEAARLLQEKYQLPDVPKPKAA
jgi:hypothetical protein